MWALWLPEAQRGGGRAWLTQEPLNKDLVATAASTIVPGWKTNTLPDCHLYVCVCVLVCVCACVIGLAYGHVPKQGCVRPRPISLAVEE